MATYNLPNTTTFKYATDATNDVATLGSGTGSGIVMGTGDDVVYLGGTFQTATLGAGGGVHGSETFVVGTDGSSSPNVVADSASVQLRTGYLEGNDATLEIFGGTAANSSGVLLYSQAVVLESGIEIPQTPGYQAGIANVVIDNDATYLIDRNDPAYNNSGADTTITAGNGNNVFVLANEGYQAVDTLIAGNGNNTVTIGSGSQQDIVSLGSGSNTVIVEDSNDLWEASRINGGSGASNTLVLANNDGDAAMGSGVVGFATVEFNFSESAVLTTSATDPGLLVEGTTYGGDIITLAGANQSYIADTGYVSGTEYANTVMVTTGSIGAGVALNGGAMTSGPGSTLVLFSTTPSGANDYNFNAATVENFSTVVLVDSIATLDLNSASYVVDVDPLSSTPLLNLVGGAGNNEFDIFGGASSAFETFQAGSVVNGGSGSESSLVIGSISSQTYEVATAEDREEDYRPGAETESLGTTAYVDLTKATIAGFENVEIEGGSTLVLTTAQVFGIDSYAASRDMDPNAVFTGADASTLVIDVSPGTTNLNVADLHLASFESTTLNTVEIVDANSTNDTIYGGSGTETIDLAGTGNYWVNDGSGNDTILVTNATGTASVLIAGNNGYTDTFDFTNSSTATLVVGDTLVGSTTGSGLLNVTGAVDFTSANLLDFDGSDSIDINSNSTAIFTINQFAVLATEGVVFEDAPALTSVLEIEANLSVDTITQAEVATFGGLIDVHVTASGFVTIDETAVVGSAATPITIQVDANSGFETIEGSENASSATNIFNFDVTNAGTTFETLDTIDVGTAAAAVYNTESVLVTAAGQIQNILEVGFNTDFTGAEISGTFDTIEIAAGATATLTQAQVGAAGVNVFDYTPGALSASADLTIDINENFSQSGLNVETDPGNTTSAYYYSETLKVEEAELTINLEGQGSNNYLITVDEMIAGPNLILAGMGPEDLYGASGSDTFAFDENDGFTSIPFIITDTINGGGGSDVLQVGDPLGTVRVNDDFEKATISEVQQFNVYSNAQAIFTSTQLDGYNVATATNGTLVVHVTETSNTFSLVSGRVSNVSTTANFNLTNSGSTILIDNMTGSNSIFAGSGAETIYDGQSADSIYAGSGLDTIVVRNGASGLDKLYGNSTGTTIFDFTLDGGVNSYAPDSSAPGTPTNLMNGFTTLDPKHLWHDGSGSASSFFEQNGVISGGETATMNVYSDVDFSHATISGLTAGSSSVYIASGDAAVFSTAELAAFAGADLASGSATSGLVVDVANAGLIASAGGLDLTANWGGSVTLDAVSYNQSTGETIDASGLTGLYEGWSDYVGLPTLERGVYIYGAAGDTLVAQMTGGDYIQGGGAGTTIEVEGGGSDYLAAGPGNSNVISFESTTTSAPIDAAGDIIRGGGGTGETIEIGGANSGDPFGYVNFDGNASIGPAPGTAAAAQINAIDDITFNNGTNSGTYVAEFSYQQLVADELTLTAQSSTNVLSITETDTTPSNSTADMTVAIVGTGNIDLRSLNTSGFGAYDAGGGAATIEVYDTNTSSVTVYGTENGTANPGLEAGDNITVQGLGDSVVLGSGANSVDFVAANVANNVQFSFSNLNGGSSLGAQGSIVQGLLDSDGYVDLSGFNVSAANGAVASSAGGDLGVAFQSDSVVRFSQVQPGNSSDASVSGGEFLATSGVISGPGVTAGANAIVANFKDSSHAAVRGFITETDGHGDIALYYVATTGAGAGSYVQSSDIHLVGVFEAAQSTAEIAAAAGAVSSSFFHIH